MPWETAGGRGADRLCGPMRQIRGIAVAPSLLTLSNSACGFLSLHASMRGDWATAAWLLFLGMVFDALDGHVARLSGQTSDFGAQLDSLADVVSFSLAPAFLAYGLILENTITRDHPRLVLIGALMYFLCGTLRLARFNIEKERPDEQPDNFAGMPSPAAAGVIASLAVLMTSFDASNAARFLLGHGIDSDQVALLARRALPWALPAAGVAMVTRLPYRHVARVVLRDRRSFGFVAGITLLGLLAVWDPEAVLPLLFLSYAVAGPVLRFVIREGGTADDRPTAPPATP